MPTKTAFAGEKGTWWDYIKILLEKRIEAHEAKVLAQNARERMKDANYWAEAVYNSPSPICVAIFFKGLLPFLK
jgi:hypothetical protein